jgi:RNA polymerase sigma-70 factor (ECF subfamily)
VTEAEEILKNAVKGKRKYQDLLYDRFSALVYGIALRYGAASGIADDIFQEAFIKIFSRLKQVKDARALPGWIRQVTVRTALDHVKGSKITWISPGNEGEKANDDYRQFMDKISNDELMEIINTLPEGYRLVFNMYAVDGFSHQEIAEQLSIGESTSRSQLSHARKLLQRKLKDLGIMNYESVI